MVILRPGVGPRVSSHMLHQKLYYLVYSEPVERVDKEVAFDTAIPPESASSIVQLIPLYVTTLTSTNCIMTCTRKEGK